MWVSAENETATPRRERIGIAATRKNRIYEIVSENPIHVNIRRGGRGWNATHVGRRSRGVAMNHPATFVLPLSASRVLDVLHCEFQVGELCVISQDEIAQRGNISEASVSRAMPVLVEHGFIEREKDRMMNGGRGGYWLRLLPLPALEGSAIDPWGSTIDPLPEGSIIDPFADDAESPANTPNMALSASPCGMDQLLIPSAPPMVLQDSLSQEEESRPLLDHLLTEPGMNRKLAERISKHPPGGVADFLADLQLARTFADRPFYFTVAKWRDGQRVIAPEVCYERPERNARTRPDTAKRQLDPTGTAYPERGPVRTRLTY